MKLNELFVTSQHYLMNKNDVSNTHYDLGFNPDAVQIAKDNSKHYDRYKNNRLVQLKPDTDPNASPFTTMPQSGEPQSPGFRGRERTKERANLPHFKYDVYDPKEFKKSIPYGPANIFTT